METSSFSPPAALPLSAGREDDMEVDGERLLHLADEGHALDARAELRAQVLRQVHPDAVAVDAEPLEPLRALEHVAQMRLLLLEARAVEGPAVVVDEALGLAFEDNELRGVPRPAHVETAVEPAGGRLQLFLSSRE